MEEVGWSSRRGCEKLKDTGKLKSAGICEAYAPSCKGKDAANKLFRRRAALDRLDESWPMQEVEGVVAVIMVGQRLVLTAEV